MNDEKKISDVIGNYAEGMKTANVAAMKPSFHELATLCGYLGEDLIAAPIQGLYDWVEETGGDASHSYEILEIDITGRVATAKIRETDSHGVVIDYFNLLKVGDEWSIVSKIWDSEPGD